MLEPFIKRCSAKFLGNKCEPIIKARSSYAQSSLLEFVSIIVGSDGVILANQSSLLEFVSIIVGSDGVILAKFVEVVKAI